MLTITSSEASNGLYLLIEQIDRQAAMDLICHIRAGQWMNVAECEEYFVSDNFMGLHAHMKDMDGSTLLDSIVLECARQDEKILKQMEPAKYMSQEIQQLTWRWDAKAKCIRSGGERFEIRFGKRIRPHLRDTGLQTETQFNTVGLCVRAADAIMRAERVNRYRKICRKLNIEEGNDVEYSAANPENSGVDSDGSQLCGAG